MKHTQNRPKLILIKNSSKDSTEQTNPEKYDIFSCVLLRLSQSAADTSLAFGASRSG